MIVLQVLIGKREVLSTEVSMYNSHSKLMLRVCASKLIRSYFPYFDVFSDFSYLIIKFIEFHVIKDGF